MPRSSRALLFDLDDTLYPLRRFHWSGFAAVARHVAREYAVDERAAFTFLIAAARSARGRELDRMVQHFGVNVPVAELVRVIRTHEPVLRLSATTAKTLARLRDDWQLAIVTNGIPAIQQRKVKALGLDRLVDTVVYASNYGSGEGKPDREPFLEALARLDVSADDAIVVGDDVFADVFGAARCGMRTIQTREWKQGPFGPVAIRPDVVVHSISEVPAAAEHILPGRLASHAA